MPFSLFYFIMTDMRRSLRVVVAGLALLLAAGMTWQVGFSQDGRSEFFPQTRHTVSGPFLDFYRAIANPELVYGYPITPAFTGTDGLLVQYFQRARFENRPGQPISLTPLGSLLYQPGRTPAGFSTNPAACERFGTGFDVCSLFLQFYLDHGGPAQFGLPISPVERDGLRSIQYFEYARLEWYPDSPDPSLEVQLGPLGRLYFDSLGEDPGFLRPPAGSAIIEITALRIHAFPAAASVPMDGPQSIFVILQDQTFEPVLNSEVRIRVVYPSGAEHVYQGPTNEHGYVQFPLDIDPAAAGLGLALVEATASSGTRTVAARASFLIQPLPISTVLE